MVFCVTLSFVRQHRATTLRCKQDGFATPSEELICARLIFLFQLGYADFAKEKALSRGSLLKSPSRSSKKYGLALSYTFYRFLGRSLTIGCDIRLCIARFIRF
jgi:hypothetical protein